MLKYSKFTDNIGSENLINPFCQNTNKVKKKWGDGGGCPSPDNACLARPWVHRPEYLNVLKSSERGKMVNGEGLQVLNQTMKSIDPDENGIYKFLGVEQADGLRRKKCITE